MDKTARYVYFGSSEFSAIILDELCQRKYKPLLVITKPDKPRGRGLQVLPTLVSQFSDKYSIQCLKPQSLADSSFQSALKKTAADLFIVADYGNILPAQVLALPRLFTLCVHPSLLPRYRGAAPIEYSLLNGDSLTGVTIFKMNERIDAGDIVLQEEMPIEKNDDYHSLRERLARQSVDLVVEAMQTVEGGTYTLRPQDEQAASRTPRLTKEDGRIRWDQSATAIYNRIRAMAGWPSAYTYYKGKQIQILAAELVDGAIPPPRGAVAGAIAGIDKSGLTIATGQGLLRVTSLKPQGKKPMSAWDFVSGYRVRPADVFGDEG